MLTLIQLMDVCIVWMGDLADILEVYASPSSGLKCADSVSVYMHIDLHFKRMIGDKSRGWCLSLG